MCYQMLIRAAVLTHSSSSLKITERKKEMHNMLFAVCFKEKSNVFFSVFPMLVMQYKCVPQSLANQNKLYYGIVVLFSFCT